MLQKRDNRCELEEGNKMTLDIARYLVVFIVFFLLLEQVLCFYYVPYLDRFGIIVCSKVGKISIKSVESMCLHGARLMKLSFYKNKEALFLKNRYPYHTLWLGPCVCAARIAELERSTVRIDVTMCPLLFSFFVIALVFALVGFVMGFATIDIFLKIFLNLFLWFCGMYLYFRILTAKITSLFLRD